MGFLAAIPAAFATIAGASTATAAELAAATTTIAVTTAAVSGAAMAYQGYTAYKANRFQEKLAKRNAAISEQNADAALLEGTEQAAIEKMNTGRRVAGALAAQGANGIDVGFGSPVEVRGALQNEGDLDALTIQYNASRRALGYATEASGFKASASGYRSAGMDALASVPLNVGASFLSSASSIGGRAASFKAAGITY